MKQHRAVAAIGAFVFALFGCSGDTAGPVIINNPPPVIVQPGALQLHLSAWNEPDKFIIQGTAWVGEPPASADSLSYSSPLMGRGQVRGGPVLSLPAKFKSYLGQKNTPAYIAKLLESEIYNEQTLQAHWAANTANSNVRWTSPVAVGDVMVDGPIWSGGTWEIIHDGTGTAPPARQAHAAAILGDDLYIFGGYTSGAPFSDFWRFSLSGGTWTQLTGAPQSRDGATLVAYAGKLYLYGGYKRDGVTFLNDVWEYNPTTTQWTQKTSGGGDPRGYHTAVVWNGKMLIHGGTKTGNVFLATTWAYDLVNDSWEQKATSPQNRSGHIAGAYLNRMVVYGGWGDGGLQSSTWQYDINGNSWAQRQSNTVGRWLLSGAVFNGGLYAIAGENGTSNFNTCYRFDIMGNFWTQVSSFPDANGRHGHSSSIDSVGRIYTFGGSNTVKYWNDVNRDSLGYLPSGYIQTQVMDLGSVPTVDGQWRFQNLIPAGTSIQYEAWVGRPDSIWAERANPKNVALYGVAWSGTQFVAVGLNDGTDAYIVTSPDGITWTERANPKNFALRSVAWSGTQFVAVGNGDGTDAYIVTSPDGITWTERANPKNVALYGVAWSGTQFVAVGLNDGTDAYIVTSPDGITWTERGNPKLVTLRSVAWSGTQFVAVGLADGTDAYIVTSPDGITWTERANPKNVALYGVAWSGTQFVAVGLADGTDAYIVTSPDGITWTERANPKNVALYGVAWSDTQFVAVGNGDGTDAYIVTSPDGITWTERANPKNFLLFGVAWSGSQLAAVGLNDGTDAYIVTKNEYDYLGTVIDGQAITERSRYYMVKATLSATVALDTSPTLRSIMARFPTYRGYATDPRLGYEASILSVSAVSTKISDFDPSTISQITLNMAFSKSLSEYLTTKYPKNKEVRVFAGFIAPDFAETDFFEYYRGLIDDWPIEEKDTISIKVKDFSKLWDVPVPVKWQSSADDLTWTDAHPVDVMLDIFRGYVGSTDAELDQTSFDTVKAATPGWKVTRTITGNTIAAKDLLEELRQILSAYFVPQPNGRIKLKRWSATEAAVASLSDRDFIKKKWDPNSKELWNEIDIYFGHAENPSYPTVADLSGDDLKNFYAWMLAGDATSKTLWKETGTKQIKDKWTRIAGSAQVTDRWNTLITRYANPPETIQATVDMRHMEVEAGDILDITTLRAPSSDMSGISGKKFQVVQKNPDFDNDTIVLKLLRVGAS